MPRERDNEVSKAVRDADAMKAANAAAIAKASNTSLSDTLASLQARQKQLDDLAKQVEENKNKALSELKVIEQTGGDPLKNPSVKPAAPEGYDFTWDGTSWKLNKKTTAPTVQTGVVQQPTNVTQQMDPATAALIQSLQSQISAFQTQISSLTNQQVAAQAEAKAAAAKAAESQRQSIISVLTSRFGQYGLGSLVNKIKELAVDGATEATITLALQETEEYKQRFAANQDRIKKNLAVLSPAEYLATEDAYRQTLRAYGLNQFDNDQYVRQFISNDVSPQELSSRVSIAVQRVQNADPAVTKTLRDYYGIGVSDMVGYILDPNQTLPKIQQQVAAAEIGVAARRQGLEAGVTVAEQLARQGITEAEAQKGYATIADILPSAEKLSQIYGTSLEGYGQAEAEQEVFNSLASAQRKRRALTAREVATFSGSSGTGRGSLGTSTAGQI